MRVNDDGKTVAAMDVLAPGIGEIVGGSQREERLDVLDARMRRSTSTRFTTAGTATCAATARCPHAGFGLGFERTLAYVTGLPMCATRFRSKNAGPRGVLRTTPRAP